MKKIILYTTITLLFTACNNGEAEQTSVSNQTENRVVLTDAQFKNADIKTAKIESGNMSSILKVNGSIDVPPKSMVSISAPLGGFLKSTDLIPGMHVKKGQVLAIMEDQQYVTLQQDYLTAKAKLMYTEEEFQRQKELNKSKATSDKMFQEAQMNYTNQKVLVKSLSEKLKLIGVNPEKLNEENLSRSIRILAPIDGYVTGVNINIGKYSNPSDILFELVDPTDIHLVLNVFEKDIDKLTIGQDLVAYTNNNPDKKYPCKIILIGKELSHERNTEIHCHFEQYDESLIPGMFMNAEIETKSSNSFVLPDEAIVRFEGNQYIFVQTGERQYDLQHVQTHMSENGLTQIEFPDNFNAANKEFVTKGAYTLLMKMKNTEEE